MSCGGLSFVEILGGRSGGACGGSGGSNADTVNDSNDCAVE